MTGRAAKSPLLQPPAQALHPRHQSTGSNALVHSHQSAGSNASGSH
eukprot:CAMPEP_0204297960 /NCGR_PEP_ID=MMETSP0468-20130131/74173_1 /ASSEMBLY_ACC=CAM_ASM_000383 /TAXON_ID=2969 /ORGANISM="Oxyrrhis marina" /LENGTH=45 /DNA_ID= /DNA_START= /DNA_END= /DNA_ORIENTATION=